MRLIFLHGWGANAADLLPLGEALQAQLPPEAAALQVQSWDAPDLHPAGGGARQWYDLNTLVGLRSRRLSANWRPSWIPNYRRLAQNPWCCLGSLWEPPWPLRWASAGPWPVVIGCSGYPHPDWSLTQAPQAPTLLMHGADDAVVPVAAQAALAAEISRVGGQVEVFTFAGGHTIPIEAIERAAEFLAAL